MTPSEIIKDLKSRGERSIKFHEDGTITSMHGRCTCNTWIVGYDGELKCIDCKTIQN